MPGAGGEGGGRQRVLGRRSVLLVIAGGILTALAIVSLWSWRTFASSQGFADVTTDVLKEPAIRAEAAEQIIGSLQDLPAVRRALAISPGVETIIERVIETRAFQGIFHSAVRQLHSEIVDGARSRLNVDVEDSAQLLKNALNQVYPEVASAIPEDAFPILVDLTRGGTPADTLILTSSIAGWLAGPLAVGAVLCFLLAVRWAVDRRRAIEAIGFCLVTIGVGIFAVLAVGVSIAAHFGTDPRQRTALRAVFWSFTHLLNVQGKVTITIGAVLVVAASYVGRGRPAGRFRDAWEATRAVLGRPRGKVALSLVGIAAAAFAMAFPAATAAIAVRIGAFVAFVAGTVGVLDVISERDWSLGSSPRVRQASTHLVAGSAAAIAAISAVLLFGGLSFVQAIRAPNGDHPSMSEDGCNGHHDLCDRRVDEVAFAGTHNSMSALRADGTWFFPRHVDDIIGQLANDVRAFLIDMHYGERSGDIVRTDLATEARKDVQADLTPDEFAQYQAVVVGLGAPSQNDRREVYLCHGVCELGATRASDVFREIDDWLRENPNEVIIIIVEDHVDDEDAIEAFDDGGLADRAYSWDPDEPPPTLAEMISSGKNVLVLAENGDGDAAPWYVPAWDGALEDTRYDFDGIDDFSCSRQRGEEGSSLFLLNHWIAGDPDSGVAAEANAMDVLGERAEHCAEERQHVPNIVAVDFATKGDLIEVVDRLNRLIPVEEP
jgi:hypothetical protein